MQWTVVWGLGLQFPTARHFASWSLNATQSPPQMLIPGLDWNVPYDTGWHRFYHLDHLRIYLVLYHPIQYNLPDMLIQHNCIILIDFSRCLINFDDVLWLSGTLEKNRRYQKIVKGYECNKIGLEGPRRVVGDRGAEPAFDKLEFLHLTNYTYPDLSPSSLFYYIIFLPSFVFLQS